MSSIRTLNYIAFLELQNVPVFANSVKYVRTYCMYVCMYEYICTYICTRNNIEKIMSMMLNHFQE